MLIFSEHSDEQNVFIIIRIVDLKSSYIHIVSYGHSFFSFWIISLSLGYKANIITVSCEITVTFAFSRSDRLPSKLCVPADTQQAAVLRCGKHRQCSMWNDIKI